MRSGIRLAARRDVGMADDILDRVASAQGADEATESEILVRLEGQLVAAFQLDADGEIVAALQAAPRRGAGMPGAQAARNELQQPAVAPDQEMGGDAQMPDLGVIGMRLRVEGAGKQPLDAVAAELSRRKGNGVDHDQLRRGALGSRIAVRRGHAKRAGQPALGIQRRLGQAHSFSPSRSIR